MRSPRRDPYRAVPARALMISAGALAVPSIATMTGGVPGQQEPLLWLLALVPAFLLAYYRGWSGAAVALVAGMAALALGHVAALGLGHGLPDGPLLVGVTAAFVGSTLGIGWTTELLHRRFLRAQEQSTDVTLVLDRSGTIRYVSPSVGRVLGLDAAAVEGRELAELVKPGTAVPASWDGRRVVTLQLVDSGGGTRVLEVTADLRWRRRGETLVSGRDVTDRVRSEEQHRRIYRMQAISQLAKALAHDFSNVLTTIRGHVHLLQDEVKGVSSAERGLVEILEASERASNFVELLLSFTRQQALRPRAVDVNDLLLETRSRFQELLGTRAPAELDLESDLPRVFVDPSQLRRVLLILTSRAAERIGAGGRYAVSTRLDQITEAAARRYPYPVLPGDYVVLTVTDTGPSLSLGEQARIFEPFAGAVGEDATGLELSSVYGTVKQSGGYVWVESQEGLGTSFLIFLPLASSGAEEPELEEPVDTAERGMVLVAEDDVHVRAVVCRVLLKEGYYVLEASDGEEALRLAEHVGDRLGLVVTDLAMPRMGGRELGDALRASRPELPILFMSGHTEEAPRLADGDAAFIMKPFSPKDLAAKLRTLYAGAPA